MHHLVDRPPRPLTLADVGRWSPRLVYAMAMRRQLRVSLPIADPAPVTAWAAVIDLARSDRG
ncbi:MAG TPA: hypothetical protein VEB66_18065 [Opitutaceae bacterium]|nr:hypothetical protein [Opitutaceae bacterium]